MLIEKQFLDELKFRLLERQKILRELIDVETADYGQSGLVPVAVDQQAQIELSQIKKALLRMQQATFGACVVCQKPIDYYHLKAYPHIPFCSACSSP